MKTEWKYDIEAGCIHENDFWYCALQFNGLFHLDIVTGEREFLSEIPNEETYKDRLVGGMHYCDGNIYMVPFSANHISVYNTESKSFKQYDIEAPKQMIDRYNSDYKWQGSVLMNKKIYMFGLTHSGLCIFDIESESIIYDYKWMEALNKEYGSDVLKNENGFLFEKSVANDDSYIYVSMGILNAVLKIDTNCDKYEFIRIGEPEDRFYNIKLVNQMLIMFYKKHIRGLIVYNLSEKTIQNSITQIAGNDISNAEIIVKKGKLLIVPLKDTGIVETTIDFETYRILENFCNKNCMYYLHDNDDYGIVFYTKSDARITHINDVGDYYEYELYKDEVVTNILRKKCINGLSNGISGETKDISLNHFLDAIISN